MTDETPTLHLLKAENLPTSVESIGQHATAGSGRALAAVLPTSDGAGDEATLGQIEYALRQLAPPGNRVHYTTEDMARLPDDRYEEHDLYFGAVRVEGAPTEVFTRTLLEAYRGHLRDAMSAQVEFVAEQRGWLAEAFEVSFALLAECHAEGDLTGPSRPAPPVPVAPTPVDPHLRWRLGHQVFFALIQSLIVTVACAEDALLRADRVAADLIGASAVLMRGSAAALRYAADFSPVGYARAVRPSMEPPRLEPKFSGLQLRDHRYLIKVVGGLRARIASADEETQECYRQFVDSMAEAYDEHKLVCARFGGTTEPSLRMNAAASMSAVDAIERLKRGRLRKVSR